MTSSVNVNNSHFSGDISYGLFPAHLTHLFAKDEQNKNDLSVLGIFYGVYHRH